MVVDQTPDMFDLPEAFMNCCLCLNKEGAEWVQSKFEGQINLSYYIIPILAGKPWCEDLQTMIRWLHSLGYDIHYAEDAPFRFACRNGHLQTAKIFWDLGGVNHAAGDNFAFRSACEGEHLHVARWLMSLGGIDFSANEVYMDDLRKRWRGTLRSMALFVRTYYDVLEKRYKPDGPGFEEAKKSFYASVKDGIKRR